MNKKALTPLEKVRAKLTKAKHPKTDCLTREECDLFPPEERRTILKRRIKREVRRRLRLNMSAGVRSSPIWGSS